MVFPPIKSGANGALLSCPIQRVRVNQLEVLLVESAPVMDGKEKMSSLEEIDCSAQHANADTFIPGRKYCSCRGGRLCAAGNGRFHLARDVFTMTSEAL